MIKVSQVVQELRAVAAEYPDGMAGENAPDGGCRYFNPDDTPCCIVGYAISRLGLTAEDFRVYARNQTTPVTYGELNGCTPVNDLIQDYDFFEIDVDEEVVDEITEVQREQDHGRPWIVAIQKLGRG